MIQSTYEEEKLIAIHVTWGLVRLETERLLVI